MYLIRTYTEGKWVKLGMCFKQGTSMRKDVSDSVVSSCPCDGVWPSSWMPHLYHQQIYFFVKREVYRFLLTCSISDNIHASCKWGMLLRLVLIFLKFPRNFGPRILCSARYYFSGYCAPHSPYQEKVKLFITLFLLPVISFLKHQGFFILTVYINVKKNIDHFEAGVSNSSGPASTMRCRGLVCGPDLQCKAVLSGPRGWKSGKSIINDCRSQSRKSHCFSHCCISGPCAFESGPCTIPLTPLL